MGREIGDRIGAVVSASNGKAVIFGYGTYQGESVPPPDVIGPMGISPHEIGLSNPKLALDNGETVYGCECWWGSEEAVREQLKDHEIEIIKPSDYRNRNSEG